MQISSFPATFVDEAVFSPSLCFWHLCQKSGGRNYMDSYVGLSFCPTDFHIHFCASPAIFIAMAL
jgi:hypothetical protein